MAAVIPLAFFSSAALTLLTRNQRNWVRFAVSTSSISAIAILIFLANRFIPTGIEIQLWQPLNLSQSTLSLRLDPISWGYLLLVVTCLLGILLTGSTQSFTNSIPMSTTIFYVGITTVAVMAANVLTALLAWALMDLTRFGLWFLQKEGSSDPQPQFRTGMMLSAVSLLSLLSVGITDWEAGGDASFLTPAARPIVLLLLALALVIRSFSLYVRAFELRNDGVQRVPSILFLALPMVSGCAFLARQLNTEISVDWALGYSLIGILGTGILMLSVVYGLGWRKWLGLGIISWSFLAVGLTGDSTGVATGGLLILILCFTLSFGKAYNQFHRALIGLVFVLAIGTPFTLGGVLGSLLTSGISSSLTAVGFTSGLLGVFITVSISYRIMIALGLPIARWPINERALRGAYLIGFGFPILVAIGVGFRLYPGFSIGSLGYAILSLFIVCLMYFVFRPRISMAGVLERFRLVRLNLSGVGEGLGSLTTGLLSIVRSVGELLEGENAVLWMLFVLLMLVLLILG